MPIDPPNRKAISGGEYAARLLGVDNPTRLVDHLIEHLSAKTGSGHESALLEFKATYHPSPEYPDDGDEGEFEWNVMKSLIALANAQGGCVLIGLEEDTDTHVIKRGDWDPDQTLSIYQEDGIRIHRDGQEEKDLINHVRKIFFSDRASRNGKNFRFLERHHGRDTTTRDISIDGPSIARLSSLVEIYPCHSETYSCNVLAAVVRPVDKGGELILVQIAGKPETLYYRDSTAQNIPLTGHNQIKRYEEQREPESPDFALQLHTPHIALQAKSTVFSNIPPPDPNFIGREGELTHLHELCLSGKIPLIHAAGGTGKTQLVFKYAALHTQDYPGGCFYIPAENANNWDAAMRELISQRQYAHGTSPINYLNLTAEKPSTTADIIQSLFQISAQAGKILLVIDNIEKPGIFFADEKLVQTFPSEFTSSIAIVATSRTVKGISHRAICTKSIPLPDLTYEEALSLLTGGEPFDSEQERTAAVGIIELLENRALYVRRMARIVDLGSRRSYKRLYKKLQNDLLLAVQPQEGEDSTHTPEVIWKWTREHIANSPDGNQDIRLAQTIALFPADGVADRILESLWYSDFGELGAKETLDAYRDDCDLFQDALKRLSEYSLIQYTPDEHIVRMHRLDRAAIRKQLLEENPTWIQVIGKALSACPCVEIQDWVDLAKAKSELFNFCPIDVLDASCWVARRPRCAWECK